MVLQLTQTIRPQVRPMAASDFHIFQEPSVKGSISFYFRHHLDKLFLGSSGGHCLVVNACFAWGI